MWATHWGFLDDFHCKVGGSPRKKKTLTNIIKVYLKASSEKKINGVYSAFKQVQNGKLILCFGGLSVKGKLVDLEEAPLAPKFPELLIAPFLPIV